MAILLAGPAAATGPALHVFDAGSLAQLKQRHAGRPFVLALWSLYCEPCREELPLLHRLRREFPEIAVELVATDPPPDHTAVVRAWGRLGMGRGPIRAFADESAERLRWSIDPKWRGELPRTYFYDAQHRVEARSGLLDAAWVREWLRSARRQAKP